MGQNSSNKEIHQVKGVPSPSSSDEQGEVKG